MNLNENHRLSTSRLSSIVPILKDQQRDGYAVDTRRTKVPRFSEFFMAWSTVSGCVSFRTANRGKNFFAILISGKFYISFFTKGRFSSPRFAK